MAFGFIRLDANGGLARFDALAKRSLALLVVLRLIAERISNARHTPRRIVIDGRDSAGTLEQFESGPQTLWFSPMRVTIVGLCEQRRVGRRVDAHCVGRRLG